MYIQTKHLKDFIIDSGLISRADFEDAEEESKKKKEGGSEEDVGKLLVSKGLITNDDFRRMQAYVLGIPFVNLKNKKIDFEILSLIPEPIARNNNIIAFNKTKDSLEVAMLDTDDLSAIDFVKKKVGLKILPRLTDDVSLKEALLQYQKTLKAEFGDIIKREAGAIKNIAENEENTTTNKTNKIKILTKQKQDKNRLPQDERFKIEVNKEKVSLRVSILPTHFGEKTVMRLLKENTGGFSLEGLGFHGEGLERIHMATKLKTGMILTTGPTGSGKTTTLYTILDILNTPDVNISTVEDPIEYQMSRINQTQVKPSIGFTFASGLRSLVRQDPDIIMVGEIRDEETAALAINASLTGHLVLSTLHTNSASGAIPRLLDMGVEPFLLVSTINVIIAKRLVRKLCSRREKYFLSEEEIDILGKSVDIEKTLNILKEEKVVKKNADWKEISFYKPKAVAECEDGYSGRIGIHEVLRMSSTIKELIMKGATAEEIENQAKKEEMLTMIEDGIFKAVQGITTIEEVLRVISE